MAAEELLKDFVLLQRAIQQVRVWANTDLRVAESGLQYYQDQVNALADEAYTQRWRRGLRESERAIACLQGLGHKRATLASIREERGAVVSYTNSCRSLANIIFLRVRVGRSVEERIDCDASQVNLKIFSYIDGVDLYSVRDFFDGIYTGWLAFIEAYNRRAYSGYGSTGHAESTCYKGRAMPNYLHEPQLQHLQLGGQPASSTGGLDAGAHRREPRRPGHVHFGSIDQQ